MMTLRQLRSVEAVMRHRHFGRAAEATAISQPALSVQLRELEAALGARLFERGPRGATPTAFGAAVAERASAILRAVGEIEELARAEAAGLSGTLRLGVIPTIAPYLLPRALAALRARWPGLDVAVRETMTHVLLDELTSGRIDAAVLALPVSEPALAETPLFDEAFVLVRPEGDAPPPAGPAELASERLLLLEEGHCFRDQALAVCGMGRAPGGLDGSSLATLVQMVGAGLGVTLIPEMAIDVETRAARVRVSRFEAPAPRRTVGMVWRRTTPMAERLAEVAETIREAAAP